MAEKKLLIILNTNQEYIRHVDENAEKYAAELSCFFESISNTYIPLLEMLEHLEKDSLPVKFGLVLTPVLCTLLEDSAVQAQYISWLEKRIEFGSKELERCAKNPKLLKVASLCVEKARSDKEKFEKYNRRLVRRFLDYKKKGFVELLATCGTDIFLPHYYDMPEIMGAQVESGIFAYRSFFGEIPEGFWLPELGYYDGIEKVLRAYGLNYTILSSESFLFSEIEPKFGIFSPARFANALVAFGKEPFSQNELYGEEGFVQNKVYRNQNRDVGFDLPSDELEPFVKEGDVRYSIGFKYWNNAESGENIYNLEEALKQAQKDAALFVEKREKLLLEAEKLNLKKDENPVNELSLTVTLNVTELGERFAEGIYWLENVLRLCVQKKIVLDVPKNLAKEPFSLQRITPYYGAASGEGYGEDLLSSKNSWMMRYVRKASERMVDLSDRFPTETGLKARLLNLGAKELMFAQSSGWARMIHTGHNSEYAEMRFKQSINDFTAVFDALGSNTVSTEWLTKLEIQHQIFPWMNYRIFSKKI